MNLRLILRIHKGYEIALPRVPGLSAVNQKLLLDAGDVPYFSDGIPA